MWGLFINHFTAGTVVLPPSAESTLICYSETEAGHDTLRRCVTFTGVTHRQRRNNAYDSRPLDGAVTYSGGHHPDI